MNNRQNAWESFCYFWMALCLRQICKSFWKRNRRRTFNRQIRNMLLKLNFKHKKFQVRIIAYIFSYCDICPSRWRFHKVHQIYTYFRKLPARIPVKSWPKNIGCWPTIIPYLGGNSMDYVTIWRENLII